MKDMGICSSNLKAFLLEKHEVVNKFRSQAPLQLNTYESCGITEYDTNDNPKLATHHTSC